MDRPSSTQPTPVAAEHRDAAGSSMPAAAFGDIGMRVVECRHPLRFVWSMDSDGRFSIEPGDFRTLVGAPTGAAQGLPWSEAARLLAIDAAGAVARAVATRDTWSGIVVEWPVEAAAERLPVILSGLPLLASDRTHIGYRGFGVCRDIARITAAITARRIAAGDASAATADTSDATAPPEAATPDLDDDFSLPPAPGLPAGFIDAPDGGPRLSVVPHGPNVVPLRTNVPIERRPALSSVERNAFQEIARALGARLEGEPRSVGSPAADAEGAASDDVPSRETTHDLAAAPRAAGAPTPAAADSRLDDARRALEQAEAKIGALEAARQEAERASAAKSEFLAQLAHEIRTPLTAIMGFSEAIKEERFGPLANERYQAYVKDIHASGQHIISLLNDLLDLAKIEAGMLDLTLAPVDLNEIMRSCVAMMQPQAGRDRIIMRAALAAGLPPVMGDARSLRQIALNLLSNSVKFTGAGGQVIVSTALADSGEVILRVRDTGIGMSAPDIEVALEPFRQVAPPRRPAAGTGLGLPLTKALVEANGGQFRITSEVSAGTLVEILFPAGRA